MMTRKDFCSVADVIAKERGELQDLGDDVKDYAVRRVAGLLCTRFEQENANFDPARFLTACGIVEKGVNA